MDYGMRQTDKKGTHGSWPTLCPRLFAPSGLFLGCCCPDKRKNGYATREWKKKKYHSRLPLRCLNWGKKHEHGTKKRD